MSALNLSRARQYLTVVLVQQGTAADIGASAITEHDGLSYVGDFSCYRVLERFDDSAILGLRGGECLLDVPDFQ